MHLGNPFSQIAKQVGPAVVNINTESTPHRTRPAATTAPPLPTATTRTIRNNQQGNMQDFFNKFFGGQ